MKPIDLKVLRFIYHSGRELSGSEVARGMPEVKVGSIRTSLQRLERMGFAVSYVELPSAGLQATQSVRVFKVTPAGNSHMKSVRRKKK